MVNSVQEAGVQIPFQTPVQNSESSFVQTQEATPIQIPEQASQAQMASEAVSTQSVPVQSNPFENVFSGIKQGALTLLRKSKTVCPKSR